VLEGNFIKNGLSNGQSYRVGKNLGFSKKKPAHLDFMFFLVLFIYFLRGGGFLFLI